jgi:hypothetical protein
MEAVGPEGRLLKRIADLLMACSMPAPWLSMIAVQFSLRRGGNLPASIFCTGSTCAVRGRLACVRDGAMEAELFGVLPRPLDDLICVLVVGANLSPEVQSLLAQAEVQPHNLERVRETWVAHAVSRGYPLVTLEHINAAADTVVYSVGLGPFVNGLMLGCKGLTCPGTPKVASG